MLSIKMGEALGIDAVLTTLSKLDLTALGARELLELAARCEKAARHHDVVRYDLSHELHQREVGEIGRAHTKCWPTGCGSLPPKPAAAPSH
jgi:hypothetical protein